MNVNPKISVIVPVYNVEKYLSDCIQSILNQTYQNFELILVDDGSTDTSCDICRRFASKDSRIRCVAIDNSGANHARKVGVDNVIGEYSMFVDADDTIDDDALTKMLSVVQENCDIELVVAHMKDGYRSVSSTDYLFDLLNTSVWASMCFKLYKTDVLKENFIDIPKDLKYGEDLLQSINIARYVNKVEYCAIKYYNYRVVETSASHTMRFSQEYENKYHNLLKNILSEIFISNRINEDKKSEILISWYKCRLNGLKTVVLSSANFNFQDSEFLQLKNELRSVSLSVDNKILLYSNPICCKSMLKSYRHYCNFKRCVKNCFNYFRIKKYCL
jgi:glycosyltransferase involved in cell wall biosynthesis